MDFIILTPRLPGTSKVEHPAGNITVRRFGPTRIPPKPTPRRFSAGRDWIGRFARLLNLRAVSKRTSFDLIHVHRPPLIELAYFVARRGQIAPFQRLTCRLNRLPSGRSPRVLTDHGLFVMPSTPNPLDIRWFMEWVLEEFDHVICVDKSGFERANSIVSSDPRKFGDLGLHHIPQPMDTKSFSPSPMPDSRDLIVGYSGRWERDGMFILQSLVGQHLPRVRYIVSGGATDRDLAAYAPTFLGQGIEVRANLLGREELVQFYRDIHILVDFYRGDGCGRSVLEAMACGRPVIRTQSRDTHPVADGETGYLVDSDAAAYARLLREIAAKTEERCNCYCRGPDAIASNAEIEHKDRIEDHPDAQGHDGRGERPTCAKY